MNKFRVVQLRSIGSKQLASGYLVKNNLVLTACHLFKYKDNNDGEKYTDNQECNICFLEDADDVEKIGWNPGGCELVWSDENYDMALLKLTCELPKSLMDRVKDFAIPDFGKFDADSSEVEGIGLGFAHYKKNTPPELYSKGINLSGKLNRDISSGILELTPSLVPEDSIDWQGISGTALFANGYLVGVVTKTDGYWGKKVLNANAISDVYKNSEFCGLVFAESNQPLLYCIREKLTANKNNNNSSEDLDKLLLNLNYGVQQEQVANSMKENKIKVFLLPPNGQYAQQWLVKRLARKITNYEIGNRYEFWASGTWNSNLAPFWSRWENELSKKRTVEGEDVVLSLLREGCKPQQPLIIIIHNIQKLKSVTLTQLLTNFWEKLITLEISGRCVLFLTQQSFMQIDTDAHLLVEVNEWQNVNSEEVKNWVECQKVRSFLVNCSNRIFDPDTLSPLSLPNEPDEFLQELWGICNLDIGSHFNNNWSNNK